MPAMVTAVCPAVHLRTRRDVIRRSGGRSARGVFLWTAYYDKGPKYFSGRDGGKASDRIEPFALTGIVPPYHETTPGEWRMPLALVVLLPHSGFWGSHEGATYAGIRHALPQLCCCPFLEVSRYTAACQRQSPSNSW